MRWTMPRFANVMRNECTTGFICVRELVVLSMRYTLRFRLELECVSDFETMVARISVRRGATEAIS